MNRSEIEQQIRDCLGDKVEKIIIRTTTFDSWMEEAKKNYEKRDDFDDIIVRMSRDSDHNGTYFTGEMYFYNDYSL